MLTKDNQKVKIEPKIYQNVLYFEKDAVNLHTYENKIRAIFKDIGLIIDSLSVTIEQESILGKEIRLKKTTCFNLLKIAVRQGIYGRKELGEVLLNWLNSTIEHIPKGKVIEDILLLTVDGKTSFSSETHLQIHKFEDTHIAPHAKSFRTLRFG